MLLSIETYDSVPFPIVKEAVGLGGLRRPGADVKPSLATAEVWA